MVFFLCPVGLQSCPIPSRGNPKSTKWFPETLFEKDSDNNLAFHTILLGLHASRKCIGPDGCGFCFPDPTIF